MPYVNSKLIAKQELPIKTELEYTRVVGDNLRQRACKFLEAGLGADCKFLVGEVRDEIQACRLLLAIASPVFEAMLYGDLASTEAVEVPDIEPPVFKQLLKFIYCHHVKLSSIEEAFAVFSVAHKYMMPDLCDICVTYTKRILVSNKSWQVWCVALNLACLYKNEDLKQFVLQEISNRGRTLLNNSQYLAKLDAESLIAILQQGYLDVESEVEVVKDATLWAIARCEDKGLPAEGRNLRDILIHSGVLRHIRFLTLTGMELEDGPLKSGIITSEEVSALLQFMCTKDRSNLSEHLCPISECRLKRKEGETYNTVQVRRDVLEIKQGSVLTVNFRKRTNIPITLLGLTLDSQVHDAQTSMNSYEEEINVTVHYKQTSAVGLFKKRVNYNSKLLVPLENICRKQKIVDGDFEVTLKYIKSGKYPGYVGYPDPVNDSRRNTGCGYPQYGDPYVNQYGNSVYDYSTNPSITLLHTKLNDKQLSTRLDIAISYQQNPTS